MLQIINVFVANINGIRKYTKNKVFDIHESNLKIVKYIYKNNSYIKT
jgi:hypothetical protein